jgi:hypothetical protein
MLRVRGRNPQLLRSGIVALVKCINPEFRVAVTLRAPLDEVGKFSRA